MEQWLWQYEDGSFASINAILWNNVSDEGIVHAFTKVKGQRVPAPPPY
jgi:hypothetical protein